MQRGGGCPILENIQGQVGHSSEQPFLVENVPAHGRGGRTRWLLKTAANPNYLGSMISLGLIGHVGMVQKCFSQGSAWT